MDTEGKSHFLAYVRQKGFQIYYNVKEIIRVMKGKFLNETFFQMSTPRDTRITK